MSTPCSIIVPNGNKYRWIYVHYDGTPDRVGVTLYCNYKTDEKVNMLISLGALSSLGREIGEKVDFDKTDAYETGSQCVAYFRDDDQDLEINESSSLNDACPFEFAYLWQNGKWIYYHNRRKSDLTKNKDFIRGLSHNK